MEKLFSIIVPIYKNEENLPITIPYMLNKLDLFSNYRVEIILINDGSPDNSWEIMKKFQKNYPDIIRIARLTRNFGQRAAMRCGMELAKGDVIGMISADMQDPFELFLDMIAEWENGCKFVIATRSGRNEKGLIASLSKIYHKMVNKYVDKRYPIGGFDFLILDREVVDTYLKLPFNYGFEQVLLLWLGYEYKEIPYIRKKREVGKSGYRFWSKFEMVLKTFITQTDLLFNIMMTAGVAMFLSGLITIIIDLILLFTGVCNINIVIDVSLVLCLFCGTIQISLSVVGKYIWYLMDYTKNNPSYILDEMIEKHE